MWARSISSRGPAGGRRSLRLEDEVLLTQFGLLGPTTMARSTAVFQLPHIADPRLLLQLNHRGPGDSCDLLVHGQGKFLHEMFDQRRDIFPAVAERRQFDMKNIETVEEIGAKCAVFDQLLKILLLVAATQRKSTLIT